MTNASDSPDCPNCGARLSGQYCGNCGQRSHSRLISLWELLRDAFGDLLELDSRLWRTLRLLLTKPGRLTKDYLLGRRARYMPPFRTYLVLSVTFFVVAFFSPTEELSLLLTPAEGPSTGDVTANSQLPANIDTGSDEPGLSIGIDDDDDANCDSIDGEGWSDIPDWLARRVTPERAKNVCERIKLDKGKTFVGLLLDNIPIALIVLMPLMALVLKVLYPLSRRYFVEHLLFFVNFHTFFFLILILQILFIRIMRLLPVPAAIPILATVAASFYIPVYLYLAMRRVYGQNHFYTALKYVTLLGTYLIGISLTLLTAVVFALLSV